MFSSIFFVLALVGNQFHTNPISGYHFNLLAFRMISYFALMIGCDWFFLVLVTYICIHNMNYLKFIYFDLIPSKKPFNVSGIEFNNVTSKLKNAYQFSLLPLGLMGIFLIFICVIYFIPLTFYMLLLGNFPPLSSLPDASGDLLVMRYTPLNILFLNTFIILGGMILWFKLPHAIQTIPEELYSIPSKYLDILLRLDSSNQAIIANLQNGIN